MTQQSTLSVATGFSTASALGLASFANGEFAVIGVVTVSNDVRALRYRAKQHTETNTLVVTGTLVSLQSPR